LTKQGNGLILVEKGENMSKVSISEFNTLFGDWQKSARGLRFGQFFVVYCSIKPFADSVLFYEQNTAKAIGWIYENYIEGIQI